MASLNPIPAGDKTRSTDRILIMRVSDGFTARNGIGNVDPRLFTGDNKLHARMDPSNCLWYVQYENGVIPESLKTKWTSFVKLKKDVETYYKGRNIEVVDVID